MNAPGSLNEALLDKCIYVLKIIDKLIRMSHNPIKKEEKEYIKSELLDVKKALDSLIELF